METWKVMIGLAGALAVFAAVVSVAGGTDSPVTLAGLFVLAVVVLGLTVVGYRIGWRVGTRRVKDGDE